MAIADESVNSFADRSDLSEGVLRKYLSGSSLPGLANLIAIAEAADVSIEWLATGRGPMPRQEIYVINWQLLAVIIESFEKKERNLQNETSPQDKALIIGIVYNSLHFDPNAVSDKEGINDIVSGIYDFVFLLNTASRGSFGKKMREAFKKIMDEGNIDKARELVESSLARGGSEEMK